MWKLYMQKQRVIAGATGVIGQFLTQRWLAAGYDIVAIGRDKKKIINTFGEKVKAITWNELKAADLAQAEVIINLTGAGIGEQRWTSARKREIILSRVESTQRLVELCKQLGKESPALFNASAIGVYGLQTEYENELPTAYDEDTPINFQQANDFLADVGRAWELAAKPAEDAGIRVVYLRFAVVLAAQGGALQRIALPFKFGLGGPIGSGNQPFCWVSLIDLAAAIEFLIPKSEIKGAVNIVAPECVAQKQFAKTLGKILQRSSIIPTPAWILKLIFGQMAEELLLKGQHVTPMRLQKMGFTFQYPTIEAALKAIYYK